MLRLIVQVGLWIAFTAVLLFWPAGTLDWPGAWIFLVEMTVGGVAITAWLYRYNPALLRERLGGLFQKTQVIWDKVFMVFIQLAFCGWIVAMGLDAKRWGLSHVPPSLSVAGAILIALCFAVTWLTFRENSFAVPVVKIQKDRGHAVVTTGPYSVVRHPMYAGTVLYFAGLPLLLGSWVGFACVPLLIAALMIRIGIEERALQKDLDGYSLYAQNVRYRLVPGLW